MKRISIVILITAFAWSIQACTNRNNDNNRMNNNNLGDSLNHDTMAVPPPLDTSQSAIDSMKDRNSAETNIP